MCGATLCSTTGAGTPEVLTRDAAAAVVVVTAGRTKEFDEFDGVTGLGVLYALEGAVGRWMLDELRRSDRWMSE